MNTLQSSLRTNAIFSGLTGLVLIALNRQIAQIFGTENNTVFWVIGILLVFFAGTIIYEIRKQRTLATLWIIIQDLLWVIGSTVLLVFNPFAVSLIGLLLIGVVAVIVLYIAINQANALKLVDNNPEKEGKRWKFERVVESDKQTTWQLISDIGNYALFAPNIDNVTILSGQGKGMVRTCSHGKDTWAETCTLWSEYEGYAFTVHTGEPDYPYPFKFLNGYWGVEEVDASTTKIVMQFDFQYNKPIQKIIIHPFFRTKFFKIVEKLLDNWQKELEEISSYRQQNMYDKAP